MLDHYLWVWILYNSSLKLALVIVSAVYVINFHITISECELHTKHHLQLVVVIVCQFPNPSLIILSVIIMADIFFKYSGVEVKESYNNCLRYLYKYGMKYSDLVEAFTMNRPTSSHCSFGITCYYFPFQIIRWELVLRPQWRILDIPLSIAATQNLYCQFFTELVLT